jgi:polygalacturonase
LLARSYSGVTQVDQRDVQAKLAPLSLSMLRCEGATLATLTRWGIRNLGELAALPETALVIRTPATRHNADGIDIDSLTNATVNQSSIEAGDDGIAIKTNSAAASNITVENTRLYGTHGLSIGSQTFDGVTNVLFNNDYVYGVDLNGNASTDANAINIKTDPSCGGPVNKVLYQNICITEAKHLIVMNTAYGSCSGSPGTPVFTNIVVNGAKSINSVSGAYTEIHGVSSSNLIDAYLANISLDVTKQSSDQYADVALDNSNITPSGTGVTTRSFTVSGSGPTCSF